MRKLVLLSLLAIAAARPAAATGICSYSYTCSGSCGDLGASGTVGGIPGDVATCESVKASNLRIYSLLGASVNASGCSCSGGGGGGVGVGLGDIGGLGNQFSTVSPVAPESGRPFFTPHYTESTERWQEETEQRQQGYASLSNQRKGVPMTSVRYQRRFSQLLHGRYCDPAPCGYFRRFAGARSGSRIVTPAPRVEAPSPPRMTGDPGDTPSILPMIQGGGAPITGTGAQVGPKDTPPPPSPEKVQDDGLCRKGWWHNSATGDCYPSRKSCRAHGVADQNRACVVHRP
jgi:hypothetical protein